MTDDTTTEDGDIATEDAADVAAETDAPAEDETAAPAAPAALNCDQLRKRRQLRCEGEVIYG